MHGSDPWLGPDRYISRQYHQPICGSGTLSAIGNKKADLYIIFFFCCSWAAYPADGTRFIQVIFAGPAHGGRATINTSQSDHRH